MFAPISSFAGEQPFNDWFAPDTTQRHPLGLKITAVDPYWGLGVFMYIKSTDAILKGSVVMWDEAYQGVLLPTSTLQGFPWAVAMAPMASGTYGWVQTEGRVVYQTNATVSADAIVAIAAAGIIGATATGKQLTGVRNRISATGTKTVSGTLTTLGSHVLRTSGYDGLFLGMALSGTGIPASTVVAKLDPDGRTIYMGSAIGTVGDKTATATGSITLTGTYTGFGSGIINNPTTMVPVA
ncbi:MAG: hypothetical protein ACXWAT_00565 [Methylobacter sp.]